MLLMNAGGGAGTATAFAVDFRDIGEQQTKSNGWYLVGTNLEIEAVLEENTTRARLSLELNATSVAGAVEAYIECKMSDLAKRYRKLYAGSERSQDPG